MVAALLIPPLAAKTTGVKEALYFSDPLLICSALFLLMLAIDGCHPLVPVGWGAGVKNPYVKICLFKLASRKAKPLAHISSLASSLVMLVLMSSTSPVRDCKDGSTVTSYIPLLVCRSAVMSHSSL